MKKDNLVKIEDIFKYTYYDDNNKLTATLDVDNLKKILEVDKVELQEDFMITR